MTTGGAFGAIRERFGKCDPNTGYRTALRTDYRLPNSRYPGNGDRETSMTLPVRLLAAATVCAALLIPAKIAFSGPAQMAAAVGSPAHTGR
jgi:hypothetical protein